MRIIPAIDIIDGKCVRLSKGDYDTKKIYNENPVEVAKEFEDFGIQYLHLVDLDGAKAKKIINQKVIESIAKNTNLIIDFGGGIRSEEDLQKAFDSGSKKVTLGSIAVVNPELCLAWLEKFGAEKLILGADCLDRKIKTSGWLENSETDVVDFIKEYQKKGFKEVVCTDISKDGMLQGPSTALYQEIIGNSTIELVASGGISNIEDVQKMKKIGCAGTIIGKAIYEGRISLEQLSKI
ncbi:1-(5-phosphoribosyl)-5-[(5-phosphoribosylamino)methylideneamino]imidazole-4-carboxamide isomerase [Cloacibacterium caeni]|uniref:1-(5-phosphoribosyl)-5-[(5- phosphoribosylamino)methylideneamino]imidazole-4- carboxamide isomerase n=1 Tax=Cloacibacterium caeni TaxID=2004710 RepID=UPI001BCD213E|nr:1-(5-phosphoribosyl)-5-[(5-phosphoribosylamino)methylideneamino]imidazole-4-carboxamide isomerase [Cloacibacterium caeni]